MAEHRINNRKVGRKPVGKKSVEIESTIFSKKIDQNLWEAAAKGLNLAPKDKQSVKYQLFKAQEEKRKYSDLLSNEPDNKIDFNC